MLNNNNSEKTARTTMRRNRNDTKYHPWALARQDDVMGYAGSADYFTCGVMSYGLSAIDFYSFNDILHPEK